MTNNKNKYQVTENIIKFAVLNTLYVIFWEVKSESDRVCTRNTICIQCNTCLITSFIVAFLDGSCEAVLELSEEKGGLI